MVYPVHPGAFAEAQSLRHYCKRYGRSVECFPGHPKWEALTSVVSSASRAPVVPTWVRITGAGISWALADGVFGTLAWDEFRPDGTTDWIGVRQGGARAAILAARRNRPDAPCQKRMFKGE